jgi:phosphoenolpyruvate carboxykinase (GTP)
MQKNTIFTNVLLKNDKTVWWEGADGEVPQSGIDWTGKPWEPGMKDKDGNIIKGANPNSRFTAPIRQCPSASPLIDDPEGVPISAIIFGGRRAALAPLVYESFNWQHGVFVGSIMASEITAAQYGAQGQVRRDPMAMLPFCGYNMADYFAHWLNTGNKIKNPPRIYNVNWFRTDNEGNFLWPGFGDNLRVLEWIVKRCSGEISAHETPIGYLPHWQDIELDGLGLSEQKIRQLLEIDSREWLGEVESIRTFYKQFGDRLPSQLSDELANLEKRLNLKYTETYNKRKLS